MPGTKAGGLRAAQKVKARYGEDHYKKIGAVGGAKSRTGGFYKNRELASRAGRIGGKRSKPSRRKQVTRTGDFMDFVPRRSER